MSNLQNPYAPPKAEALPVAAIADGYLIDASQAQRLANLILDEIFIVILATSLSVALTLVGGGQALPPGVGNLIGLVTVVGYYALFEGTLGRTPGKFITGTRVVTYDGGTPTFGKILGRSFARLVPFEPFSFLTSSNGWHDRWSRTRVVRVQR